MDKPPKPPKNLTLSGPTPITNNASNQKSSRTPQMIQKKLPLGKLSKPGPLSRIQGIDLAQDGARNDYARFGPRDYRKLHQLHERVTKASPIPTVGRTEPSHSLPKSEHSFLGQAANLVSSHEKISSDYDDSWMDDLPSPSVLLGSNACVQIAAARDSTNAADSLVFDENISDIEADMVGLSDSFSLKENSAGQHNNNATSGAEEKFETSTRGLEYDDIVWSVPSSNSPPRVNVQHCVQQQANYTMSLGSSEKSSPLFMKRKAATLSVDDDFPSSPPLVSSKKPKVDEVKVARAQSPTDVTQVSTADLSLPSPTTVKTTGSPSIPTIKAGHPAWVYDLDPVFVAEYEDYVEFV